MCDDTSLHDSALREYLDRLPEPVFSGFWTPAVRWSFYLIDEAPPLAYTTAAFCVAITPKGLVLTRTHRGVLEHLGGHREGEESITETACREALEEGGMVVEHLALVAVRKVETDESAPEAPNGKCYPPIGFIPYFVAFSSQDLVEPKGVEVVERVVVPLRATLTAETVDIAERREAVVMIEGLLGAKLKAAAQNEGALLDLIAQAVKKKSATLIR